MTPCTVTPLHASQELLPKYKEQDAKQGPSSQFAERAGSGLQSCTSSKELRGLGVRAQVRVWTFFSRSLLRGLPQSRLPRAAASRTASKCNTGSRYVGALPLTSTPHQLLIQFTVSNTFTSCDSRPCPQASMSLLNPRRVRELVYRNVC